jgi:hypothetical protein
MSDFIIGNTSIKVTQFSTKLLLFSQIMSYIGYIANASSLNLFLHVEI